LVTAFLRRLCQICPFLAIRPSGFHFFGFRNNNFFLQSKVVSLESKPNLEDQVSVFTSPSDRVAQLYPQALGSYLFAFYYSQGYGGGILTLLHIRGILYRLILKEMLIA
jgi:hypothetical protein